VIVGLISDRNYSGGMDFFNPGQSSKQLQEVGEFQYRVTFDKAGTWRQKHILIWNRVPTE